MPKEPIVIRIANLYRAVTSRKRSWRGQYVDFDDMLPLSPTVISL